jgi:hypothetical protein
MIFPPPSISAFFKALARLEPSALACWLGFCFLLGFFIMTLVCWLF